VALLASSLEETTLYLSEVEAEFEVDTEVKIEAAAPMVEVVVIAQHSDAVFSVVVAINVVVAAAVRADVGKSDGTLLLSRCQRPRSHLCWMLRIIS
jgi:subtilase family serine protease